MARFNTHLPSLSTCFLVWRPLSLTSFRETRFHSGYLTPAPSVIKRPCSTPLFVDPETQSPNGPAICSHSTLEGHFQVKPSSTLLCFLSLPLVPSRCLRTPLLLDYCHLHIRLTFTWIPVHNRLRSTKDQSPSGSIHRSSFTDPNRTSGTQRLRKFPKAWRQPGRRQI